MSRSARWPLFRWIYFELVTHPDHVEIRPSRRLLFWAWFGLAGMPVLVATYHILLSSGVLSRDYLDDLHSGLSPLVVLATMFFALLGCLGILSSRKVGLVVFDSGVAGAAVIAGRRKHISASEIVAVVLVKGTHGGEHRRGHPITTWEVKLRLRNGNIVLIHVGCGNKTERAEEQWARRLAERWGAVFSREVGMM